MIRGPRDAGSAPRGLSGVPRSVQARGIHPSLESVIPVNERSLFVAALEIEDPSARREYLDGACRDDPALRRRVDNLLAALEEARSFMDRPASDSTLRSGTDPSDAIPPASGPATGMAGTLLADRYRMGEQVGRGGMGTIYRAEQLRPVRRPVAVKLINPGMDSRSVLARFEAERQALAVMDHPHIARVLDAGATPDGRPFFVMELVAGVPLTEYCDGRKLPLAGRLELFRQVCGAVQHAHQKGVIHRDIKPSNILVEDRGGAPAPKVIDFGLAKAFGGLTLTDQTLLTAPGSAAGTPLYMAPEQAGPDAGDVDTRADVYALGAVLYELLTGSPPIGREALRRAALHEVLRLIREQDPQPPSSRLGSSADLPMVAVNRGTEPARLGRSVRGDLDWVVMKALEKDRGRRYESAAALADDVGRFLNHEPVTAGPPTLRYRTGKFVQRNRGAVAAASAVLMALALGMAGITWGLFEARRQRDAAGTALRLEAEARGKAEANLAYAKKGNEILGSVFAGLDPEKIAESGRPLQDALRDNLRTAVLELEGSAVGDPLTVAEMQDTLALSMKGLGEYESATALLEKAAETRSARLGPGHRATLSGRNNLAEVHRIAGRLDKAVPLFEQTLAAMRAELGPDDITTLDCMGNLGLAYLDAGRAEESVGLLERTLALRKAKLAPDHPDILLTMNNLAGGALDLGRIDQAVSLYEQTLALRKAKLAPDHPHTLNSMNNLACAYKSAGRVDEAISLWEQTLRLARARLGHDHPDALAAMNNLAGGYRDSGRPAEAVPIHEEALRLMRLKLGPDHPDTLRTLGNLGGDFLMASQFEKAAATFEESLARRGAKLGPDHPDTLGAMNNLARTYRDWGKLARAIPLFERAIPMLERRLGRAHPTTQATIANLGISYLRADRPAEALPLLEEAYAAGRDKPAVLWAGPSLIDAYARTGRSDDATRLIRETTAETRRTRGGESPELSGQLAEFGLMLLRLGKFAEAEPLLRESLAIRERSQPDDWSTYNTLSQLGGALLGRKEYGEAEPLLLRGHEGLSRRKAAIPPEARDRLPEAIDRLVELYSALDRPGELARWRAERAGFPAPGSEAN